MGKYLRKSQNDVRQAGEDKQKGRESANEKIKVREMMEDGAEESRGMLAQNQVSEWLLFDKRMWNEFLN